MRWLCLLLLGIAPAFAFAHRVDVFPYWDGDKVRVEAFFPDGSPVKGGKVRVFDSEGKFLAEGLTDQKGSWAFVPQSNGPFKVVLEASMGHRAEAVVEAREGASPPGEASGCEDSAALRALVREAVREELVPLLREIKKERAKPSLRDVVGGLGWIVGIIGLWMALRRKGSG